MSSIERQALLQTILEHPDDDTPRLVFADWLQEHDEEERAEFIRVQIELAKYEAIEHTCGDGDPHSDETCPGCLVWCDKHFLSLERRPGELFDSIKYDFPVDTHRFDIRRGFLYATSTGVRTWFDRGPTLVAEHPITMLRIVGCNPLPHTADRWAWWYVPDRKHFGDCELPKEIFTRLVGWQEKRNIGRNELRIYDKNVDAEASLIVALLEDARERSGVFDFTPVVSTV